MHDFEQQLLNLLIKTKVIININKNSVFVKPWEPNMYTNPDESVNLYSYSGSIDNHKHLDSYCEFLENQLVEFKDRIENRLDIVVYQKEMRLSASPK